MIHLLDVKVLIALGDSNHPQNAAVKRFSWRRPLLPRSPQAQDLVIGERGDAKG
jgi:hypothetical protein